MAKTERQALKAEERPYGQLCPDVRTDARMLTWRSHKFFFLPTEVFPDVNI